MGYATRLMSIEDISQVIEIDRESFPTDWYPTSFKRELSNKLTRHLVAWEKSNEASEAYSQAEATEREAKGKLWWLASMVKRLFGRRGPIDNQKTSQNNQKIVGYATFWLMMDEAHLTSIAVREAYQRQGIGELLLISAINMAAELNAQVITLEVRASNLAAQALYEKYGFAKVGVRRRYYSDDAEDAVVMTTERITSGSYQARFQQLKRSYTQRWRINHLSWKHKELSSLEKIG